MFFLPIKTRPLLPPKDDIYNLFDNYLPKLWEGDVLVITSKIAAIHQGRTVPIKTGSRAEKTRLAMAEADWYVKRPYPSGQYSFLTIIHNAMISSAGIDKSNGGGYYVFLPRAPFRLAREIWKYLRRKNKIRKLGVVILDSQSIPLRYGTMGISIGFFGLEPLIDYRGKPDLFGRLLEVTRANVVDSLAVMANLLMGESNESTPLLLLRGAKFIKFTNKSTARKLLVPLKQDMYAPLIKVFHKVHKKKKS